MDALSTDDLYSLEEYHKQRNEIRARALAHKRQRQLALGEHLTFQFEDRVTIQYQIQEMLRIERIFETESIQEELDAYNPLIPDGMNLKATLMIEYADVAERRVALARLAGLEHRTYLAVEGFEPVYAIADEDMDRSNDDKTSAVHFLRFEFEQPMIDALRRGASLTIGCDHDQYRQAATVGEPARSALIADFA